MKQYEMNGLKCGDQVRIAQAPEWFAEEYAGAVGTFQYGFLPAEFGDFKYEGELVITLGGINRPFPLDSSVIEKI